MKASIDSTRGATTVVRGGGQALDRHSGTRRLVAARKALIVALQLALLQPVALWPKPATAASCAEDEVTPARTETATSANEISSVDGFEGLLDGMPGAGDNGSADAEANTDPELPGGEANELAESPSGYPDSNDGNTGDGGVAWGSVSGTDGNGGDWGSAPQDSAPRPTVDLPFYIDMRNVPGGGGFLSSNFLKHATDPIDVVEADKAHVQVDYLSLGAAPLRLARVYHSNSAVFSARVTVPMGQGWRMFYDRTVETLSDGSVRLHRANGRVLAMAWNGAAWTAANPAGVLTQTAVGWTYLNERDQLETYDNLGRLVSLTASGHVTAVQYDASGRLWRVVNPFGRTLNFAFDANGRLATGTLPGGGLLRYGYDGNDRLTSIQFADGAVRQYAYENPDFPNALTGVVDESGRRRLSWSYDSAGRPNGGYYGSGVNAVGIQYNGASVTTTDARGTQRTRSITSVAGRPAITSVSTSATADSSATAWSFAYDANGNPGNAVGRSGELIARSNDARGLPLSVTRGSGTAQSLTTTLQWHGTWRKPVQTVAAGVTRRATLDAAGRVTQVVRSATGVASTTVASRSFNALNLMTSRTDARGATRSYTYDAAGNVTSVTDPQGRITTYGNHNSHGQAGSIVRSTGSSVTRIFDGRGRLVQRTDAGLTTGFSYDAAGRFSRITRPDGSYRDHAYTLAGHLTSISNQRGERIDIDRDATGRETGQRVYTAAGSLAHKTAIEIDAVGRVKRIKDSRDQITTLNYAADGRPSGVTDPLGRTVSLALDSIGRVSAVTQPNTAAMVPVNGPTRTTTHAYSTDGRGLHESTTDTAEVATGYAHDALNRRVGEAGNDAGGSGWVRNNAGDVTSRTDARGITASITRDSLGRVTVIATPGATPMAYGYVAGRRDNLLASMSSEGTSTAWTFDAQGRALSKRQTVGSTARTLSITRDGLGRISSMTYPSGMRLSVTYSGELVSSLAVNGLTLLSNISYRPFSHTPTGWSWGNGSSYRRSYDNDGRITSVSLGSVQRSYA